jgi:hypothetical protein
VVGNPCGVQPIAPEPFSVVQLVERFGHIRRAGVSPRQRDERRLPFLECGTPIAASADQTEVHGARQLQRKIAVTHRRVRVVACVVRPRTFCSAVLEEREAVHLYLDPAARTRRETQQRSHRDGVTGWPAIAVATFVACRTDDQEILHRQPPGRRVPRRLEHQRSRQIPALRGHECVRRGNAEETGAAIEQRAEHTRRVRARQTQPFDGPVRRDESVDFAVRQESVLGDRREHAHDAPMVTTARGVADAHDKAIATASKPMPP